MSATYTISAQALQKQLEAHSAVSNTFVESPAFLDLRPALVAYAESLHKSNPVFLVAADDVAEQAFVAAGAHAIPAADIPTAFTQPSNTPFVITAQNLALAVIKAYGPTAQWLRDARVLDANEIDILIEDLKVSGLKPGRLKEMLKFFYKSIADGKAEEAYWLITTEEQQVYAILEENLEARRALLPCEVSTQALRLWNSLDNEVRASVPNALPENLVIIADDFGSNGAQTQNLLVSLAQGGLVAIVTDSEGANAQETYPAHKHAKTLEESADVIFTLETVEPQRETQTHHYTNPNEEFDAIACQVQEALTSGAHSVLIAAPNHIWAKQIKNSLSNLAIPAALDFEPAKVKGDPRDPKRCDALREAALTKLRRNPEDFTALRSWIGLGDWLVRSDAFLELLAYAREHELTVAAALKQLAAMPDEARETKFFGKFDPALAELQNLLSDQTAEVFAAEIETSFAFDADTQVVIAPYQRCHGRHADVTIIAGAIDGFLPKKDAIDDNETIDHKKLAISRDRALFDDIVATARKSVIATSFAEDRLENADALKMATSRIIMRNEKHYARVNRSRFVDALTANTPALAI